MQRVTVKLPEDMINTLDERAEETNVSRSEVIRETLDDGLHIEDIRAEYERTIAELEREIDRLKNEKRALIEDREYTAELERYVEDELSYRQAGLGTRFRWWIFGKD